MFFGIALIFLIQWMFLGNLRCALIVAATIPVALFLAVIITVLRGESANLLSVGAIDLGIIVDATVIMVENMFRHLAHHIRRELDDPGALSRRQDPPHPGGRARGRQADLLLGRHHHRGVPAAVHHAGRGGADLRPDGAHLRVCADRRGDRHLHGDAGDVVGAAARPGERDRDVPGAADPPGLHHDPAARGPPLSGGGDHRGRVPAAVRAARRAARQRVPAQARRGQPVDPRPDAADHHARGRHGQRRRDAPHHQELRAGADGVVGAGPRRGRDRPGRLVRRRVLRAAQAVRGMAERPRPRRSWSSR